MGQFKDDTSAFSRVVRHGADEWHRLESEAVRERRERILRRRNQTREFNSPFRSSPVRSEVQVRPEVMRAALKAAGGDASRLRIVSDTEVWVV
ncbi:hypothetical protein [Streptomyces sp. NPDC091027]|uniref:hypothetical protein n=1 Tax=Streptomyces sp. NPDC091027 TaxID=3365971 RepID=UPI00380F0BEF